MKMEELEEELRTDEMCREILTEFLVDEAVREEVLKYVTNTRESVERVSYREVVYIIDMPYFLEKYSEKLPRIIELYIGLENAMSSTRFNNVVVRGENVENNLLDLRDVAGDLIIRSILGLSGYERQEKENGKVWVLGKRKA